VYFFLFFHLNISPIPFNLQKAPETFGGLAPFGPAENLTALLIPIYVPIAIDTRRSVTPWTVERKRKGPGVGRERGEIYNPRIN